MANGHGVCLRFSLCPSHLLVLVCVCTCARARTCTLTLSLKTNKLLKTEPLVKNFPSSKETVTNHSRERTLTQKNERCWEDDGRFSFNHRENKSSQTRKEKYLLLFLAKTYIHTPYTRSLRFVCFVLFFPKNVNHIGCFNSHPFPFQGWVDIQWLITA